MPDQVYATLSFSGPGIDPADVTRRLQIPAKSARLKERTSDLGETYLHGYWSIDSGISHNEDLESHIREIVTIVKDIHNELHELTRKFNINPTLSVSLYSEYNSIDIDIDHRLIIELSELNVNLSIDVYLSKDTSG